MLHAVRDARRHSRHKRTVRHLRRLRNPLRGPKFGVALEATGRRIPATNRGITASSTLRTSVRRAPHPATTAVQDVCVDHSRADVLVAEELLDGPDVVAVLQEVGRERVPQRVTGRSFR